MEVNKTGSLEQEKNAEEFVCMYTGGCVPFRIKGLHIAHVPWIQFTCVAFWCQGYFEIRRES